MYDLEELKEAVSSVGFEIIKVRKTFGFWGSFAWEIDRITNKYIFLKIILMPLLKTQYQDTRKVSVKALGYFLKNYPNAFTETFRVS